MHPTGLDLIARLQVARRLLVDMHTIHEVRAIAHLAEAARMSARQARLGLEAQNESAETKLRAQRRLGQLLSSQPKQDGGDAARFHWHPETKVPARLADLGISKIQSSRYQAVARLPDATFEQYVAEIRQQGRADGKTELTSAGALQLACEHRQQCPATPQMEAMSVCDGRDRAGAEGPSSAASGSGTEEEGCARCGSRGGRRAGHRHVRFPTVDADLVTLAYLAGAMDADGHFSIQKSSRKSDPAFWNPTYSPRIGLGQVTRAVPELLRKLFGGTIVLQQPGGRNRPIFRWQAANRLAVRACECLLPYLRLKAEQARLLVELSMYTGSEVRRTAFWYAQQHPNWADERLLTTEETIPLLGYANAASVYRAIQIGTLLAIPSTHDAQQPRIPAGLICEILAQTTGPRRASNRIRPPQLELERERIYRRVRELNRVGVDAAREDENAAGLVGEVR
jgi:hypothetical protein